MPWDDLGGAVWWERPGHLFPLAIRVGDQIIGFLHLLAYPFTERGIDYEVAGLFVLPAYRRRGVARAAVIAAFERFTGVWEVTPADEDVAQRFWLCMVAWRFSDWRAGPDGDSYVFDASDENRIGTVRFPTIEELIRELNEEDE